MHIKNLAKCLAQSKYLITKAIWIGEIMVANNNLFEFVSIQGM